MLVSLRRISSVHRKLLVARNEWNLHYQVTINTVEEFFICKLGNFVRDLREN